MSTGYRFGGGEERRSYSGPLPADDYVFQVIECKEPYQKDPRADQEEGNWVMEVHLKIRGQIVLDWPWSGKTSQGEARDGIGEFLKCVNRAPANRGDAPDWRKVEGAQGKCRLKLEVAQQGALAGKEVNKVAYYYRPKEVGPTAAPKQSASDAQWAEAQRRSNQAAGAPEDAEPDDLPF